MKKIVLLTTVFFYSLQFIYAQAAGDVDSSFGINGIVNTSFQGTCIDVQSNGKILLASATGISRYNIDGSIDNTFGNNGTQSSGFPIASIAVQDNDKFVAVGTSTNDFAVARYNSDGSPDLTFSGDGMLTTDFELNSNDVAIAVAVQNDGKIVVRGHSENTLVLARYNTDGSLDQTFDGDGKLRTNMPVEDLPNKRSLLIQPDGKIVAIIINGDFVILRYNNDGTPDNTFSGDGLSKISFGDDYDVWSGSIAIQEDGKIVVSGSVNISFLEISRMCVARVNTDGSIDNTFSGDGKEITNFDISGPSEFGYSLVIENDGKILIGGKTHGDVNNFLVARYSPGGNLDSSFSEDGILLTTTNMANAWINNMVIFGDKLYAEFYPHGIISYFLKTTGVIITRPAHGSVFNTPATIDIIAASEPDSTIKVEFYNGAILLHTDYTSPYTFKWANVAVGNYTLKAKAFYNTGGATTSKEVLISVSDNTKPTFGFNLNGTNLYNINNGSLDVSESDSVIVCNSGQYTTSVNFHSSPSNFYDIKSVASGSILYFDGFNIAGNGVFSAAELSGSGGTHTILLDNFNLDGIVTQTITPFLDINSNHKLDVGDIAGDPIIFTYIAKSTPRWYKDADGDGHAVASLRTCESPGVGWTLTALPIDDCNDNNPDPCPTVSLTTADNKTTFTAYAKFRLNAEAADSGGAISKVEFYKGTTLLHTEYVVPYSYLWDHVAVGNYIVTAKATDNSGNVTTSNALHISIVPDIDPDVYITSPAEGNTYLAPASITLFANAGDVDGTIKKVDFYNGSTLLFTENDAPYFRSWTDVPEGNYSITARATDNNGKVTTSAPVNISVIAAQITKPTFGFNFNGTEVANINNGSPDPGESASVTVCDSGQYTTSGHFHSSLSNLYQITVTSSGGTLFFDGYQAGEAIISAEQLTGTAGTHTITLANPDIGGTLLQTITPFTDLNNNGILNEGDVVGDPIVFIHTATPKLTWYKDVDGDQHASEKKRSCTSPGEGWTTNQLPVDDCNDNDPTLCPENIPPTVSVTTPTNNATYTAWAKIRLIAVASDTDGTISKVEFYRGNTLLHTEYVSPYSYIWDRIPVGNYTITAKATDNWGLVSTSDLVHISVVPDIAPTVSITSPANNATYVSPATIILSADANDVDGTIKKVDFYNGGTLLFTENDAPYFRSWPDVPVGNYSITAKAMDNNGAVTISAPVAFSVIAAGKSMVIADKLNSSKEPLSLNLNPNPVANILNISVYGLQVNRRSTISVLSVSGAVIKTIQPGALNKNVQLDVSSLSGGVYFIKVTNGDKVMYKQFVKL